LRTSSTRIFDVEDWLACSDERSVEGTFRVLDALLDNSELNILENMGDNITTVLETGGHAVGCSSVSEEFNVANGISFG
jgi:hypothetical protein